MVEVDNYVEMTLFSGEVVQGTVLEVSGEQIVFGKAGNYGLEKMTYYRDEIQKIEILEDSTLARGILVVLGVATALVVVFAIMLAHSLRGMN